MYRWYAWYLLAYSRAKNDYRTYKLVRMSDLNVTDSGYIKEHTGAEEALCMADKDNNRGITKVLIYCKAKAKARAIEYLNGKITKEKENGDASMTLRVMENEHFWFGSLLSLGDDARFWSPRESGGASSKPRRKSYLCIVNYDRLLSQMLRYTWKK